MTSADFERRLLEAIEQNPDTTQASLATQLGVAVGSINWVMKRLIRKGYVKVTHLQRRKLIYFLTPQGLARKVQLTSQYMKASLRVYRELREQARTVLGELTAAGYGTLRLEGDGEAVEIFHLTCLEQGVRVTSSLDDAIPTVEMDGTGFVVRWPEPAGKELAAQLEASERDARGDQAWARSRPQEIAGIS